jgi:hypothetical protein
MEGKMPRVGKVKVYTDEGKLIREGYARELDFVEEKIFGLFSPGELVKGAIIAIGIIFGAGVLWAKMDGIAGTQEKMWGTITSYQNKINCIQNQMAKCCQNSVYCA